MKLVTIHYGNKQSKVVFSSGMKAAEQQRLIQATMLNNTNISNPADITIGLFNPIEGTVISLEDACEDATNLPDIMEVVLLQQPSSSSPATTTSSSSSVAFNAFKPILHHAHHNRMQPYPSPSASSSLPHQPFTSHTPTSHPQLFDPSPSQGGTAGFPPAFVLSLNSVSDVMQALSLSESIIVILLIYSSSSISPSVAALSQLYHQLASSGIYKHLLFLSVDYDLLTAAAATGVLPLTLPPSHPSLQLYYAGVTIGQVVGVNEEQLIRMIESSDDLMRELNGQASSPLAASSISSVSTPPLASTPMSDSIAGGRNHVRWQEGDESEGILLSEEEAAALEQLIVKQDPRVQQAYLVFPQLSLVVGAFMRLARHIGEQKEERRAKQQGGDGGMGSVAGVTSSGGSVFDDVFDSTVFAMHHQGLLTYRDLQLLLSLYQNRHPAILTALINYQQTADGAVFVNALSQLVKMENQQREQQDSADQHPHQPSARSRWSLTGVSGDSGRGKKRRTAVDVDDGQELTTTTSTSTIDLDEPSSATVDAGSRSVPVHSDPLFVTAINTLSLLSVQQQFAPGEVFLLLTMISANHPLIMAAIMAYEVTNDIEDLVDTLHRIVNKMKQEGADTQSPDINESTDRTAVAILLTLLPPTFLSSHAPHLSSLITQRDRVLYSALQVYQEQQKANHTKPPDQRQKEQRELTLLLMRRIENERREREEEATELANSRQTASSQSTTEEQQAPVETGADPSITDSAISSTAASASIPSASTSQRASSFSTTSATSSMSDPSVPSTDDSSEGHLMLKEDYQHTNKPEPPLKTDSAASSSTSGSTATTTATDSEVGAALKGCLAVLVSEGVIGEEAKVGIEKRWTGGDGVLDAVMSVWKQTGDEEEMRDSLVRIARQGGWSEEKGQGGRRRRWKGEGW